MHGKAAEFVLQVHGDHPLTFVLGCLHVAHEALLLQLRNGKRNGIRADGDVTVLAEVHGFHDLNTAGDEVGGVAFLHAERKRLVQLLADCQRIVSVFAVDADVRHLKAERGRSCLLAKLGDLLKITGCNVCLRADPAAADRVNERRGDEFADVLRVDAAGREEFDPAKWAGQGLHRGQTAVNARREELYDVQAELHRGHNFGRGHAAGRHGNAIFHAPADDFLIKARGNDEFRAAVHRFFALFERDDGARADEHIRAAFRDGFDRIRSRRRAERDLHHIHAAGQQRICRRDRVFCVVQYDNRHNSRHFKSFRHFYICSCNSIYQNLQSRITLVERPPVIILFENMSQNPDVVLRIFAYNPRGKGKKRQ